MIYDANQLQAFWQAAKTPTPLLIVGGGRWGRVWASVAAMARGSGDGIAIISGKHASAVKRWCLEDPAHAGIAVSNNIKDAVELIGHPRIAIIASRPRDHVRDGMEALDAGANTLVEKPLSNNPADARLLLDHAASKQLVLGIATEFSFLPALHQAADLIQDKSLELTGARILWDDPKDELRYDDEKRIHSEISLLEDILPHAYSIFYALMPSISLKIDSMSEVADTASMTLIDEKGKIFDLVCNRDAPARKRIVQINLSGTLLEVDFAAGSPVIKRDGEKLSLRQDFIEYHSTLRLELGAFNFLVENPRTQSPLCDALSPLIELQDMLGKMRIIAG